MPVDDANVTYVNFAARKKVSAPEKVVHVNRTKDDGLRSNEAAARLLNLVNSETDAGRLKRGKDYANRGNVVGLDIRNGAVHGEVAGSQNEPFAVLIYLPYRSNDDLGEVAEILARTPNAIREATQGRLPARVVDILLAEDVDDIRFSCDCPDAVKVCKHVVAVVDRLALKLDVDPHAIFSMRGLSFTNLEQLIVAKAPEIAAESLTSTALDPQERNRLFWQGRELPDLPEPKKAPALRDSDMDLLRKALRTVSHTNVELLRAMSDIEDLYDFLVR